MGKNFYILSCAALVAYLCLFAQDAGANGRQSEATAVVPGASAGEPIRLAQDFTTKKKAEKKAHKTKRPKAAKTLGSGQTQGEKNAEYRVWHDSHSIRIQP